MADPLYMVMVRATRQGSQPEAWYAVKHEAVGRKFTRDQAEALASQMADQTPFLVAVNDETEKFGAADSPPTLALLPGDSIWRWGVPPAVGMADVLRTVADGAESPDPDSVLLPVRDVTEAAKVTFGDGDDHVIETVFDAFVMEIGGSREGDPPAYRLNFTLLLGIR